MTQDYKQPPSGIYMCSTDQTLPLECEPWYTTYDSYETSSLVFAYTIPLIVRDRITTVLTKST